MTGPRSATPDDLAAIQAIVRAAYAPYIARMGREPAPMSDDYGALIAARRVTVMIDGDHVVGFIVLANNAPFMRIDTLAITPAAQGRGLGRQLLEGAEHAARDAGCTMLGLYTNETMVENIALYARLGFRETRRAEEHGYRRVYFEKRLA